MAVYKENIVDIDLNSGTLFRSFMSHSIGEGDNLADRFGVRVFRDGEPVDINGTCTGYFIRNDGGTIIINEGTVSGNVAYVTLTEACYYVEGSFSLAIKCTGSGVTGTLRIVDGTVNRTSTSTIADPADIMPSVEDLIAAIDAAVESIPSDYSDLSMATNRAWWAFGDKNLNINLAQVSGRSREFNGLTFTAKDAVVTVTGTSTAASNYDMFSYLDDPAGFPFLPGRKYALTFSENDTSKQIYKQIQYTVPGSDTWEQIYQTVQTSGAVVFTMPAHYEKFVFRLVCDTTGRTYNKQITFNIKNIPSEIRPFDNSLIEGIKTGMFPYNVFFERTGSISYGYYGLTIADYGERFEVSGTASATATYMLIEDYDNRIFKPGDKIIVNYTNVEQKVYLEIVTKNGSTTHDPMLQRQSSGTFLLTFPAEFDYCRINLLFMNGTSYSSTVKVKIRSSSDAGRKLIVAKDGSGDYTTIKAAVADAVATYGTTVIVKPGTYDLVQEFGETYLDNLSSGDYGMMLMNGINLVFAPNAYVTFNYDGANTWVIQNFAPFNTGNNLGFTLDGLNIVGQNCRYLVHDDPRPGDKENYSKNVYKNCYFEQYPSPSYSTWVNHQIIGGGLGDATHVIIENCVFVNHLSGVDRYASVSYHNSTSENEHYESRITVKDCWFDDGNLLVFEGYGDAEEKTKVLVNNNRFGNPATDIIYSSTNGDNMQVLKWGNVSE